APIGEPLSALATHWRDGIVKQALVAHTLALRQRLSPLFADGDYRPARLEGPLADAMIAFVRRTPDSWALVVAPRLAWRLPLVPGALCLTPNHGWQDTAIVLDDVPGGTMNAFDGAPMALAAGRTPLAAVCGIFPLALVWGDTTVRARVPLYP